MRIPSSVEFSRYLEIALTGFRILGSNVYNIIVDSCIAGSLSSFTG